MYNTLPSLCGVGGHTQGSGHARQAAYQLSHTPGQNTDLLP